MANRQLKSPRRRKILIALATSFLLLGGVELVGRLFVRLGFTRTITLAGEVVPSVDREGEFPRLRPGFRGRMVAAEFDVPFATDAEGCRISPLEAEPDERPIGLEVAALGDSFTFGSGVAYDATFAALLARELERRFVEQGADVRVVLTNLGTPATGTHSQRLRLTEYLGRREPHAAPLLVVWNLLLEHGFGGGNDLIDNWNSLQAVGAEAGERTHLTSEAKRESRSLPLAQRIKRPLIRHSVLYHLVMRAQGNRLRRLSPRDFAPAQEAQLDEAWRLLGQELGAGSRAALDSGARMVIGYFPVYRDVYAADSSCWERLESVLPPDAAAVSVLPKLIPHVEEYSYPLDGHPKALGHQLAAEAYADTAWTLARELTGI